jgi:transcriptional antiterminator RfaH
MKSDHSASGDETSWYCVRTQPKHEHIAAADLNRNLGLDVFYPRLRLERATCRGVVNVIEPLFPCYIFVRCGFDRLLSQIQYTSGVSSLVRFGVSVPAVPEPVIEELRECFESQDTMFVEDQLFPGAEVTVAEGAFLGSRGIVVRLLPSRKRVQILLDFLGRATLAELDKKCLTREDGCLADLLPSLASPSPGAGLRLHNNRTLVPVAG